MRMQKKTLTHGRADTGLRKHKGDFDAKIKGDAILREKSKLWRKSGQEKTS